MTRKAGPPGWRAYETVSRIDGWILPSELASSPRLAITKVTQTPPDEIALIRMRMLHRQRQYQLKKKIIKRRAQMFAKAARKQRS